MSTATPTIFPDVISQMKSQATHGHDHKGCGGKCSAEKEMEENLRKMSDIFQVTKSGLLIPVQDIVEKEGVEVLSQFDKEGHSPIHWAALGGHTHVLRYFIDKKAPMDIHANNQLGAQPIHWACVNGHVAVLEILLQAGVSIDSVDNKGCTPLIIAAQYGRTMLAAFLMGKGARLQLTDKEGDNALQWAAFKGHCELTRLLIYSGLNPQQKDTFGQTPLHLACLSGDLLTVQLLCEQDGVEMTLEDHNGNTPLKLAKGRNHKAITAYLEEGISGKKRYLGKINFKTILFGPPGKTKSTFHFMLFMMCCYGYPCYLFKILPHTMFELESLHVIFLLNAVFLWYCLLKVHNLDPGFLPKNTDSYDQALKKVAIFDEWKQGENPLSRLCHTCRLVRPLRAKHCRITNRCVKHFDHYCPYIYNCVGYRNRHYFLLFLIGILITELLGLYMIYYCYYYKFGFDFILMLGGFIMFLFTIIAMFLTGFTAYQASVNLTTNERLNQERYDYLKDCNGRFMNPFDQGIIDNLREFFHMKSPLTILGNKRSDQGSIV
uniref:probable protein S-acyltransferase 23 n=1 Tax=Styela clava TaxID=7725 RepID=UPI00193A5262|nr:probable protein S-acyltransferase 23 [Styela clava]